jgi:hypothetical protein
MHDLAATIAAVREDGRQRDTRCPAHDDGRASLSVGIGDAGRVLLRCHAGCAYRAIVEAAGIDAAELAPERRQNGHDGRRSTRYEIRDGAGAHVATHERIDDVRGKRYVWRQPDGSTGLAGRKVATLPLYGAHLITSWPADAPIALCEGERATDALLERGIAAVGTVTGASGTPADAVLRVLMGRRVMLWPDADTPGRAHMERIATRLAALGCDVRIVSWPNAPEGGDAADYRGDVPALITAALPYNPTRSAPATERGRQVRLTSAIDIAIRPVRWLWTYLLAIGTLALLGGREGIGKSVLVATLVGQITRGTLPGAWLGRPRDVLIAAVEDSWKYTIVPRLMAAGADLRRVHRIDVQTASGASDGLVLPLDLVAIREAIASVDVALLVLDPLMSRISAMLDTHRDGETRQALEPIAQLADEAGIVVLGLIHVSKTATTDALTSLMGSRAFAAVARTVLYVMRDPDEDEIRLFGLAKSNLGPLDVPTRRYSIESAYVADTDEGPVWTGRLVWQGESARTIRDALETIAEPMDRTATTEAAGWLADWLATQPERTAESSTVKHAARAAGHTERTLKRAKDSAGVIIVSRGYPRRTFWTLPLSVGPHDPQGRRTGPTGPTGPTDDSLSKTASQWGQVSQSGQALCLPARAREGCCYCADLGNDAPCGWCDGPDREVSS